MVTVPLDPEPLGPDSAWNSGDGAAVRWAQRLGWLAARLPSRAGRYATAEMEAVAGSVSHLAAHSEAPFLDLGRALQHIHHRARSLQDAAADSVQHHSDEVSGAWLPRLQSLVQGLEQQLESATRQLGFIEEAIAQVGASFAESRASLHDLNANVLTLRMLATLTRIESAHLAHNARGILFLAEEVGEQANGIADRAETFLSQSQGLLDGLREARQRVERLQRNQSQAGPLALREVARVLSALMRHRDATGERLEQTVGLSRDIARHTGEVVASLQFHDITRQRLEHVAAALRQPARTRRRQQGALLRLQAGHVEHAGHDLQSASQRVSDSLAAIAGATESLARFLADGDGATDTARLDAPGPGCAPSTPLEQQLVQAEPALQAVHRGAGEITSEVRALTESLAQVFSLHGSLAALAHEVEAITEAIKRVGINASIRASTLGSQGAPLAAIAQAVQGFSSSVGEQSRDLRQLLAGMEESATRMQALADGDGRTAGNGTAEPDLDELLSLLDAVHRTFASRLDEQRRMEDESRVLAAEIGEALQGFRAHHTLLAEMQGVQARLLAIAEHTGSTERLSHGNGTLDPLEASYTMARERETHRRLLAGPDGRPEPAPQPAAEIELAAGTAPAEEEDGLGDNVELF